MVKTYFGFKEDDVLPDFISHIDDNPFTSIAYVTKYTWD